MRLTKTQKHNNDWTIEQKINKEESLLAIIEENSQLPEKDQARYQHLLGKCKNKTINLEELAEYQTLSKQLETRNLKRIEALIALAQIKGRRYFRHIKKE
ncbi:hypothetical protein F4X73_17720 [Candidatus Poribacteria bacterium]|nr:hypothetical protein [Candidatus Poribacteria bacterium]MYF56501.1 hypothetical protein [Candidatus Poribacteria bacterium]